MTGVAGVLVFSGIQVFPGLLGLVLFARGVAFMPFLSLIHI